MFGAEHSHSHILIAVTCLMPKWGPKPVVLGASMARIAQRVGIHFGSCLLQQFLCCSVQMEELQTVNVTLILNSLNLLISPSCGRQEFLAHTHVQIGQRRQPRWHERSSTSYRDALVAVTWDLSGGRDHILLGLN